MAQSYVRCHGPQSKNVTTTGMSTELLWSNGTRTLSLIERVENRPISDPFCQKEYRHQPNPELKAFLFPEFVHNLHHHAGVSLYQLLGRLNCHARLGSSTCLTRSPILT